MINIIYLLGIIFSLQRIGLNDYQIIAFNDTLYSHVAVYNLTYQKDSANPSIKEVPMALLLGEKGSVFGAYGNINVDTAKYLDRNRGGKKWNFTLKPPEDYYIQYRIIKTNTAINTYDQIAVAHSPIFKYFEPRDDIKWQLLEDTATISGYLCQKAECNYGNRNWIAWFSLEIPISDGPYKFCGLPGLIIKINDTQNYWNFSLTSFENRPYNYFDYESTINNKDVLSTTKDKFFTLLKSTYENGFEMEKQYGLVFHNRILEEQQYYRDRARRENNWIEKISSNK